MSYQELVLFRTRLNIYRRWWLLAGALGFILFFNQTRLGIQPAAFLGVLSLGLISNSVFSFLFQRKRFFRYWPSLEILLDLTLVGGIVHFSGGVAKSPLFFLYPALLFVLAFHALPWEIYFTGASMLACSFGLSLWEGGAPASFLADRVLALAGIAVGLAEWMRAWKRNHRDVKLKAEKSALELREARRENLELKSKLHFTAKSMDEINQKLVRKNLAMLALHEIYVAMSSTFNAQHLLDLVMDTSLNLFKANLGCLFLVEGKSEKIQVKLSRGLDSENLASIQNKLEKNMENRVIETGLEELEEDLPAARQTAGLSPESRCKMCVPLHIKRKLVGVITLESNRTGAFSRSDLALFSTLGSQASEVLQNIALYEEMKNKADRLSLLFDVCRDIGTIFNLRQLFNAILEKGIEVMKARRGSLMIYDSDQDRLVIRAAFGFAQTTSQPLVKVDQGIAGWVFRSAEPVAIPQVEKSPLFSPENDRVYSGRDLIACPLKIRKKVFGLICLNDRQGNKAFVKDDLNLLSALAAQASIAIENAELYASIRKDYLNAIQALAAAVDAKDHYTHGHSNKVAAYAALIAREMKLPEKEVEKIKYGAMLHDVGKIGISETLLNKPTRLTSKEFETLCMHPALGVSIVRKIESLLDLVPSILYHHERFDGQGYPEGKAGLEIPLGARIVAVADAWDVMNSDRSYRKALSRKNAEDEMKKFAGTQFDAEVVEALLGGLKKHGSLDAITLEEMPRPWVWDGDEFNRWLTE